MAESTRLMFGLPVVGSYPFTRVIDGSVHHGMEADWFDLIAKAHGLPVVPALTDDQRYWPEEGEESDPAKVAEEERLEAARTAYVRAAWALAEEMGCSWVSAGSEDFEPEFFVAANLPRAEPEPRCRTITPLPDLTVAPEVFARLQRFCEVLGIPYEEPKWCLVRSWSLD